MKIAKSMYCFNSNTNQAKMIPCPDYDGISRQLKLQSSTGACLASFDKLSPDWKIIIMLIDVWQSVIRDGVDPMAAHMALLQIDEIEPLFADDVPRK